MNDEENKDQKTPHIEPSEPQKSDSKTDNESGDPGRTPGKAEGEDDESAEI